MEVFGENFDNSDRLQAACDAGAGRTVYIPAGCYRVTRPIVVKTGTTVMGAGFNATTLSTEKAIPAILHLKSVGGPMTIVRDLWTAGPIGGNWQAAGIWIDHSNGVTVRECWVSALGTGIRIDGISDTWVRNVVFELNQHGIDVRCEELSRFSGNLRLLDCYGYQNYQTGITLTNCRGVQIQACSSVGSGCALSAKNCAQLTMTGFQVNWDASPWRKYGVRFESCDHVTAGQNVIEGMLEYGLAAVKCRHMSLSGNVVRNTTGGPGILIQECALSTISGNNVSQCAKEGIALSGCRKLVVSGNIVDTAGHDPATPSGIAVDASSSGCHMEGNIVSGTETETQPKSRPAAGAPPRAGRPLVPYGLGTRL
jgi:parallel beta-helix repeat protein